ncbi:MAG: HEPN domain-containing protein [Methylotenera sp.]
MKNESKRLHFIYAFELMKEFDDVKHFPDEVRSAAERYIVDVIYESYVVTADEDYLMARLLARKGLYRGFFWGAAQAIEKYLKAILLMNGVAINDYQHHINKLFSDACNIDGSIANIDISPHQSITVEPWALGRLICFEVAAFINEIEKHGSPNNRYNTLGVQYNTGHLFALDSLIFQLRKRIGVPDIHESFRRQSEELMSSFETNNFWFEHKTVNSPIAIPNKDNPIVQTFSVTKLEFLLKNKNNIQCGLALRWLRLKMKLPKTLKK